MKNNNSASNFHAYSALQVVFSLLAMLFLWGAALILALLGAVELLGPSAGFEAALPLFLMSATSFFTGLLLLPCAGYAFWRLMGRRITHQPALPRFLRPSLLILAYPLIILLGFGLSRVPALAWLLLPPIHILAVGLPVLWLTYLAVRNRPGETTSRLGSPQRAWGVFGSSLVLSPVLVLAAEGFTILVMIVLATIVIMGQPELMRELSDLRPMISPNGDLSQDALVQALIPYLVRPGVILSVLGLAALIVPLIEELLKPIGVWLLLGRKMTPGAGFAAGALSGAAYALAESLAFTANGETWGIAVIVRAGTAVVHILNTAILGWAIARLFQKPRPPARKGWMTRVGQFLLAYLGAVLIHGVWNGLTVMASFTALGALPEAPALPGWLTVPGKAAPFLLVGMALAGFWALIWANRKLTRPLAPAAAGLPASIEHLPVEAQMTAPGNPAGPDPAAQPTSGEPDGTAPIPD
ncbi:MAG: PrsW family intramembrane metalloprotease [Anaerolineales bacterium]|nr:PrsW family intramembrane metalloprotease [Anaerolineales bacterium]